MKKQLSRKPKSLPTMKLNSEIKIFSFLIFKISHSKIMIHISESKHW
ncbi:hypothetical protein [Fluviicola sp.]